MMMVASGTGPPRFIYEVTADRRRRVTSEVYRAVLSAEINCADV